MKINFDELQQLPVDERIAAYNAITRAAAALISDVSCDPVVAVQLVRSDAIEANDYNPNNVASPEMQLLEDSIRADGVTMPVVVIRDEARDKWVTVDGYHRQIVLRDRLKAEYTPVSVISADINNRMASTIRHNRARGKHQVDLMAGIVKSLLANGWRNDDIAMHLGMSTDELLRLKQIVGVANVLAGSEYSKSWGPINEPDITD